MEIEDLPMFLLVIVVLGEWLFVRYLIDAVSDLKLRVKELERKQR